MIELQHLTKQYGNQVAVRDLSLTVDEGELLVLLGESGSGKTTTLKMINRLIEPSAGSVLVDGRDVAELAPHDLRRRIGYAFQQVGLFPHMTVAENIGVTPALLGWTEDKLRRRVDELLALVELDPDETRDRRPDQLSGGQQQRVAIARALINQPSILLADEPTGNLDSRTSVEVMGIFQKLNTERGITVLLITHEREIAEYGTRIIAFRDGKIVSDKPHTVRRMAADEFAALPLDTDSDADSPVPAASTPVGALDLDLDLT